MVTAALHVPRCEDDLYRVIKCDDRAFVWRSWRLWRSGGRLVQNDLTIK